MLFTRKPCLNCLPFNLTTLELPLYYILWLRQFPVCYIQYHVSGFGAHGSPFPKYKRKLAWTSTCLCMLFVCNRYFFFCASLCVCVCFLWLLNLLTQTGRSLSLSTNPLSPLSLTHNACCLVNVRTDSHTHMTKRNIVTFWRPPASQPARHKIHAHNTPTHTTAFWELLILILQWSTLLLGATRTCSSHIRMCI